jgi:glutamate---cysteine ligase / carboxylate-amine ligase
VPTQSEAPPERVQPGAWSRWAPTGGVPWTIGVEEEVMLLDPSDWALASQADAVMSRLTGELASHASTETHGSALELRTDPHATVGEGLAQLEELRGDLARELAPLDLRAAVAGLHPFTLWQDTQISEGDRYRFLYGSMRELARREPTFALHVHVALPDPESAVRAINRLRSHLPLLLALSGNSPFWQGRETGLASARTPLFQAFPRVGIPRAFLDYEDYVSTIDLLLRCEAFPEPTFLWWDARLQPRFGTIEVRIMDAQSTVADSAALTALVQCLVRLEATEGSGIDPAFDLPEVLAENRFLAARDGAEASLIDARLGRRSPVPDVLDALLERCLPHAEDLGCVDELQLTRNLAATPRFKRQLDLARGPDKLPGLVEALSALF